MYSSVWSGKEKQWRRMSYHEQMLQNITKEHLKICSAFEGTLNDSDFGEVKCLSEYKEVSAQDILDYADRVLNKENYTDKTVEVEEKKE